MGSTQKIVSGVVWSTIVNIVNAIYGFVAVPILINHFGKTEYGLIGLAMSVNVYMNLMDMGFNSTNVRFFSKWLAQNNHESLKRAFQTSLSFYSIVGFINCIILLVIARFASSLFNVTAIQAETLKHLFYILAGIAICQWFSSCFDQLIKATENIAWLQRRTLFTKLLMLMALLCTVSFNFSLECYLLLTCLAQLAIVPMSINKIQHDVPHVSFLPKWDTQSFKEMLPYCLNIFSFSLFQFSFYNLRPVLLGIQGTIDAVADYRILNGVVSIVTLLGGAFTGILLPSSSKVVANNDINAYNRIAYDGTKYISILCCFCCFGMMSIGTEAISLYVGKEYLYLIPWLNLWLLCTLGTHNQAISSLILAGDNIRAINYSTAFASIMGLCVAWFAIPHYNIGGVCIAFVVYMLIQIGFYYVYYWPRIMHLKSLRIFQVCFMPFVLIGIFSYVLSMNIMHLIAQMATIYRLLVKGFMFAAIFSLCTWVVLNKENRRFILQIIHKR